ncbi:hypothetical protein IVB25_01200 [Bradyrhizobium sp. 193]|nr:hypothetical protein [Bradyrhizobium sp. 193]
MTEPPAGPIDAAHRNFRIDSSTVKKKPDHTAEAEFFRNECTKFRGIVQHATTLGNAIGVRDVGEIRGYASWLFVRACVMSKTIENSFDPLPTGFGNAQWLDHASITILCRALIECISVMLYIGDVDTRSKSVSIIDSASDLSNLSLELLKQLLPPKKAVRLLGISVSGFLDSAPADEH